MRKSPTKSPVDIPKIDAMPAQHPIMMSPIPAGRESLRKATASTVGMETSHLEKDVGLRTTNVLPEAGLLPHAIGDPRPPSAVEPIWHLPARRCLLVGQSNS